MAATTVESVVGVARTIEAPTHQVSGGTSYAFVGWSDGGAARHTISTPSANATYVATYRAIGTGAPPAAPTNLSAHASGRVVSLSWNASAGAASYRLEAGTQPGSADVFNGDIGSATTMQTPGPVGRFFARVRATNPAGPSEASNEVSFTLSDAPCGSPPPAPAGYSAPSSGLNVQPSWSPSPGATSYILEAGSSPGAADLFRANVGLATVLSGTAPPGVYFTRIRAVNGCGASDPSNEVVVHLR
jgi:cellulose 1,4-beta-cellobiosidase